MVIRGLRQNPPLAKTPLRPKTTSSKKKPSLQNPSPKNSPPAKNHRVRLHVVITKN